MEKKEKTFLDGAGAELALLLAALTRMLNSPTKTVNWPRL